MKVGVLTTHPIQYQVPWFRALARVPGVDLTVFFCQIPDPVEQGDGFGVAFQWDVPLLDGYAYRVLRNVAHAPSVTKFGGCDTPEIASVVRREGYDAFIVNGWVVRSCLQLLWASRLAGVPCIVRGESNTLRRRPLHVRLLHRLLLRQYAAYLAIGRGNRDFYLQNGVSEEHIFSTPYCVDNERFAASAARFSADRVGLRRAWGLPADACVFLFSGKLIPKKHPEDAIRALASCRRRGAGGASAQLLVVGDGERMGECRRLAGSLGLPVSFTGFLNQSEMPSVYAAADCLVLPSDDGETWGLVVNEAMACGLPAIVSDRVGCHPDLVQDGKTGFVSAFADVAALGDAMWRMASDDEGRRRMGENARALASEYCYERVVAGVMRALDYVVAKPRDAGRA